MTPFWPGAYALFERRSPMWDIYALHARSATFEQREIERITEARPAFVLVDLGSLDGRDELRFPNTHPLLYRFFVDTYRRRPQGPRGPDCEVFLPASDT